MPKSSLKKRGKKIKIKKVIRSIYSLIMFIFVINMSYLGVFFVATPEVGAAAYQYSLEGKNAGGNYTDGNITGYQSGDTVPARLTIKNLDVNTQYYVKVAHDYKNGSGVIGYDHFANLTSLNGSASNFVISDIVTSGNEDEKEYKFTFKALQKNVQLDWDAVLGDHASDYSNGSNLFFFINKGIDGEKTGKRNVPISVKAGQVDEVRKITVDKTDNQDEITVGSTTEYVITIKNEGNVDEKVNIVDYLPDHTDYISSNPAGSYDAGNHKLTWNNVEIKDGEKLVVKIKVKATKTGTLKNEVKVTPKNDGLGVIAGNDLTSVVDKEFEKPTCTLDKSKYDHVIKFDDMRLFSNYVEDSRTEKQNISLSDGEYKITLQAQDGHDGRENQVQDKEQYKVVFYKNGNPVATSSPTDDLKDKVAEAWETNIVDHKLKINGGADQIQGLHDAFKTPSGEPNSLNAVCAGIEKVSEEPKVCGNDRIDKGEQCDGKAMPEGYTDSSKFTCDDKCKVAPVAPACEFLNDDSYDHVIQFEYPSKLYSTFFSKSKPVNIDIPEGNYSVDVIAYDGGYNRANETQKHEQYFLEFFEGNGYDVNDIVATSSPHTDLVDGQNYVVYKEKVNNKLHIPADIESVRAQHAYYPNPVDNNAHTVFALCAGLKVVDEDPRPYCGDGKINNKEECDGNAMPDGYDKDKFRCSDKCEVETKTQSCTLNEKDYDVIVDFESDRLYSNNLNLSKGDMENVNLSKGDYEVTLQAQDGYYGRHNVDQDTEHYFLEFYDNGGAVATSSAHYDLPDKVAYTMITEKVDNKLYIPGADSVRAIHAAYPDSENKPNSVNAICAGFNKVSTPPTCGNGVINEGEQCDGKTMPDGYKNAKQFTCNNQCEIEAVAPSCVFEGDSKYDYVFDFESDRLYSSFESGSKTFPSIETEIEAGNYKVELMAWDGYYNRASSTQPYEQFYLEFYKNNGYNNDTVVASSSPHMDLQDGVNYTVRTEVVDQKLYIPGAKSVRGVHDYYPNPDGYTNANSLNARCAGLILVDEEPEPSACTLKAKDYKYIINFDDDRSRLSSNNSYLSKTNLEMIDIPKGEYEVTLQADDGHEGRASQNQDKEQYKLVFYDNGYAVATSSPHSDLKDGVDYTKKTEMVNTKLYISGADSVRGVHAAYSEEEDEPNSLNALCAGLNPIEEEPTPTACTLDEDDYKYLIHFDDDRSRLYSNNSYLSKTNIKDVDIAEGRYEVTLQAEDGHEGRASQNQDKEQYKLVFYDNNYAVATSSPIDDLKDGVDYTKKTQKVNTQLYIPGADSVRGIHDAYSPEEKDPNSLNALCAGLNPIEDASFTFSGLECLEEDGEVEITFKNTSIDFEGEGDETFHWDFGDGATSTDEDPVHSYTATGTYEVVLEITNDEGTVSVTHEIEIVECDDEVTYEWLTGSWGACSATCGGGTQTRTVVCAASNDHDEVVDDDFCDEDTKPVKVQACNTQSCGSTGGGGGGGSTGGGGTPGAGTPGAFAISNTQVTTQCVNGKVLANISWLTNYNANSRVVYGTTSQAGGNLGIAPNYGYAFSTVTYPTSVTGHSVSLEGLNPNTFYYFRGVSNYNNQQVIGEERFVQTPPCTVVLGEEGEPVLGLQSDFLVNTYVNPGTQNVNYELIVKNTGNLTSFNTVLTSTLPTYLTFSDTGSSVKTWNLGDLEPGKTSVIMAKVNVSSQAPTGKLIANAKTYSTNHGDVHSQTDLDVRRVAVLASTGFSTTQFVALSGILTLMLGATYLLRRKMKKMKLAYNNNK